MSNTNATRSKLESLQNEVHRFCYVFVALEMRGLHVNFVLADDGAIDAFTMQKESFPPFPHFHFHYSEYLDFPKRLKFLTEKYKSEAICLRAMDAGEIGWERPTVDALQYSLSFAHATRTIAEKDRKLSVSAERIYEQCIRMSCDESSIKFLAKIRANEEAITMLTTDSKEADRIDARTLQYVGEAFAGIAMLALKSRRMPLAVSAASAALCKHPSTLPLVNCVRLMAIVQGDLTSQVRPTSHVHSTGLDTRAVNSLSISEGEKEIYLKKGG
jgi:hypothetical protein